VLLAATAIGQVQPVPFKWRPQWRTLRSHSCRPMCGWTVLRGSSVGERGERLAQVDLEPLLDGFRKRPGAHPWIGEHIGKWMHAATLAWSQR